jgi:hypothetical protein
MGEEQKYNDERDEPRSAEAQRRWDGAQMGPDLIEGKHWAFLDGVNSGGA